MARETEKDRAIIEVRTSTYGMGSVNPSYRLTALNNAALSGISALKEALKRRTKVVVVFSRAGTHEIVDDVPHLMRMMQDTIENEQG